MLGSINFVQVYPVFVENQPDVLAGNVLVDLAGKTTARAED
jgi:hypothetical protein